MLAIRSLRARSGADTARNKANSQEPSGAESHSCQTNPIGTRLDRCYTQSEKGVTRDAADCASVQTKPIG